MNNIFNMSDEVFLKNRNEIMYDKKIEFFMNKIEEGEFDEALDIKTEEDDENEDDNFNFLDTKTDKKVNNGFDKRESSGPRKRNLKAMASGNKIATSDSEINPGKEELDSLGRGIMEHKINTNKQNKNIANKIKKIMDDYIPTKTTNKILLEKRNSKKLIESGKKVIKV